MFEFRYQNRVKLAVSVFLSYLCLLGPGSSAIAEIGMQTTTTYAAEIQARQSKLAETDRELRKLEDTISRNRLDMKDLASLYTEMARRAGRPPFEIGPQEKPEDTASRVLKQEEFSTLEHVRLVEVILGQSLVDPAPWRPLTIAGGRYQTQSGMDTMNQYNGLKERCATLVPQTIKLENQRIELQKQKEKILRELAALQEGLNVAIADSIILGTWYLAIPYNGSTLEFIKNPHTHTYNAILKVCKLNYFRSGNTIYSLKPLAEHTDRFSGKEYGYTDDGLPLISDVDVSINGDKMTTKTRDETLIWQRIAGPEGRRERLVPPTWGN